MQLLLLQETEAMDFNILFLVRINIMVAVAVAVEMVIHIGVLADLVAVAVVAVVVQKYPEMMGLQILVAEAVAKVEYAALVVVGKVLAVRV
jgi:hypothetical protein